MLKEIKKIGRGIVGLFSNEMRAMYRNNLLVEDMKAKYVKGCDSVVNLNNQRIEIQAQKKISLEEFDKIEEELKTVIRDLKCIDTKNQASVNSFNVLKAKYDSLTSRKQSIEATIKQYDSVIENLKKLIAKTTSECEKLKAKYTEIEFNVQTYKNMKRINDVISITTDGLADTNLDIEQANDDLRLEIAKFNVRAEEVTEEEKAEFVNSPEEMQTFINSL